jgi:hypothetical protein
MSPPPQHCWNTIQKRIKSSSKQGGLITSTDFKDIMNSKSYSSPEISRRAILSSQASEYVTEEDIAEVSGLPSDDTHMFSRKHIIGNVQQSFFLPRERIELKGRGVHLSSLPPLWQEVARFIKHYLTCEGRYQVVYQHDFLLLSHLRHNRWVNLPYYLLGCLKNMAHYCRKEKDPTQSLTHHRLVQLLINRGFEQQNRPLNNPPINPQPAAEIPQEQQQQNPPAVPKVPHSPPTQPTSPPTIPEPPHTAPDSSTPALHILSDDSEPETVAYPIIQERPP